MVCINLFFHWMHERDALIFSFWYFFCFAKTRLINGTVIQIPPVFWKSPKGQKKETLWLWYCIVPLLCYSQQMSTKYCISQSLWREEMGNWRDLNRVQGIKRVKERQQLMEHRESNMISGEGLPTSVAFGRECSQLVSAQQGRAWGTQFLDFLLLVHCALLPCLTVAECKPKRVRKLGSDSLYQSVSRGTERWRKAKN